jgi:multiple antibiotic resistance protein
MSVLSIALTFFLISNAIGNSPAIIALIKDFDFAQQRKIVLREAMFALVLALFFQYFGELFLRFLNIQNYAVTISGGVLLMFVSLSMIFSGGHQEEAVQKEKKEPFFVPIATPLVAGPGLLAMVMFYSQLENNHLKITMAILIAWIGVTAVMAAAPYLNKVMGKRGLIALEQLMGMILTMVAFELLVKGSAQFIKTFHT